MLLKNLCLPQSLHYNFNFNQNCRKTNIPLCRTRIELSHAKMDIYWFLCKKLKKFEHILSREIRRKLNFLNQFLTILKNIEFSTFNLIRNGIHLCNKYKQLHKKILYWYEHQHICYLKEVFLSRWFQSNSLQSNLIRRYLHMYHKKQRSIISSK